MDAGRGPVRSGGRSAPPLERQVGIVHQQQRHAASRFSREQITADARVSPRWES
jgi:hypothetical protein